MPRLGPEEDHAFQENARVVTVTCAVKTNRICWSVHALDCCRTFKRDFQAKVKAKQARWLTIPGRMLELVSWLKNSCFICGRPMFHPCFAQDFQLGRFFAGSKALNRRPWRSWLTSWTLQSWKWKRPHISRVFQKEVARWLKDVLPIGQKSVEDCVRMYWIWLFSKCEAAMMGIAAESGQMSEARLWGVVCGEGRLEFAEDLGESRQSCESCFWTRRRSLLAKKWVNLLIPLWRSGNLEENFTQTNKTCNAWSSHNLALMNLSVSLRPVSCGDSFIVPWPRRPWRR